MTGHTSGISLSSDPLLWHTQAPLLCVPVLLPLVFSSQGFLPSNHLWALSDLLCNPLTIAHFPLAYAPSPLLCSFMTSGPHLSPFLSGPLALAPAPAPAASRAPRAPRTSRAAGTPGRIAASGVAGAGALAVAQEARSAVGEPGVFCSTAQKCSWVRGGKQTVTARPRATLCSPPALGND